jgi:hypothetical protein
MQISERRAKMACWLWPSVTVGASVYVEVVLVLVVAVTVESEACLKVWEFGSAATCACVAWPVKMFELGGVGF